MRIYVTEDYASMSRRRRPSMPPRWSPAGQRSRSGHRLHPIGAYQSSWWSGRQGDLSFTEVTTAQPGRVQGSAPTHDQSYRYFMNDNTLFNHVDVCKDLRLRAGRPGRRLEEAECAAC